MGAIIIRNNAAVDTHMLLNDGDDQEIPFDLTASYRAQVRAYPLGPIIMTFDSLGVGTGSEGTVTAVSGVFDGVTRTALHFTAEIDQVVDLAPGVYPADVVMVDGSDSIPFEFIIEQGWTEN